MDNIQNNDTERLDEEEQYKSGIGIVKIMQIKDRELRELRISYNEKFKRAFEDEYGIPDHLLDSVYKQINDEEQEAIIKYKKLKGIK